MNACSTQTQPRGGNHTDTHTDTFTHMLKTCAGKLTRPQTHARVQNAHPSTQYRRIKKRRYEQSTQAYLALLRHAYRRKRTQTYRRTLTHRYTYT